MAYYGAKSKLQLLLLVYQCLYIAAFTSPLQFSCSISFFLACVGVVGVVVFFVAFCFDFTPQGLVHCVCGYEHIHVSSNAPNDVAFHVRHVRVWASWQHIAKGLNTDHDGFRNNQLRDKFMNPKPSNYLGVAEKYPHNWL